MKKLTASLVFTVVVLSLALSCGPPPLRQRALDNHFIQGDFPAFLDLLVVLDSSSSFTAFRRELRDDMIELIDSLNDVDSQFRFAVTSGGAKEGSNSAQTLVEHFQFPNGHPGLGLDGTMTTSLDNSEYIVSGENAKDQFIQSVDKINLLTHLLIQPGLAYYNNSTWSLANFRDYYGTQSNYFNINFNHPSSMTYLYSNALTSGSILGNANNEQYFQAIKMANQKMPGIFSAVEEYDRNNVPLVILIVKDETPDQSHLSNLSNEEAKEIITNLRRHTVNGVERSHVSVFSLVQNTDGPVATVTQELNDEDNGVTGEVYPLSGSASSVSTAINAIKTKLQQPQTVFCLKSRPLREGSVKVYLDDELQTEGDMEDYIFNTESYCVEFNFEPTVGSVIDVTYN